MIAVEPEQDGAGLLTTPDAGSSDEYTHSKQEPLKPDRYGTPLAPACFKALEVVNYLAERCSTGVFNARKCKKIDINEVLSRISATGLSLFDVNDGPTQKFSVPELGTQLRTRSGRAFVALAHLGYMYWAGPQYSKTTCQSDGSGLLVRLTDKYKLNFDSDLHLKSVDYTWVESE